MTQPAVEDRMKRRNAIVAKTLCSSGTLVYHIEVAFVHQSKAFLCQATEMHLP